MCHNVFDSNKNRIDGNLFACIPLKLSQHSVFDTIQNLTSFRFCNFRTEDTYNMVSIIPSMYIQSRFSLDSHFILNLYVHCGWKRKMYNKHASVLSTINPPARRKSSDQYFPAYKIGEKIFVSSIVTVTDFVWLKMFGAGSGWNLLRIGNVYVTIFSFQISTSFCIDRINDHVSAIRSCGRLGIPLKELTAGSSFHYFRMLL